MKRLEDMTEPELRQLLVEAARGVKAAFKRLGVGEPLFALLVFNDPKVSQYIANCERDCMIQALREGADRLANQEDVPR